MGGRGQALAAHRGCWLGANKNLTNGVHFDGCACARARARDTSASRNALDPGPGTLAPPRGPWPRTLERLRFSRSRSGGDLWQENSKNLINAGGFDVTLFSKGQIPKKVYQKQMVAGKPDDFI